MARLACGERPGQAAISSSVRRQPMQLPLASLIRQTPVQGDGTSRIGQRKHR
jgi:hypothetical protein